MKFHHSCQEAKRHEKENEWSKCHLLPQPPAKNSLQFVLWLILNNAVMLTW